MSLAVLDQRTEIVGIIAGPPDLWAVYRAAGTQARYLREPVRAWALIRRPDGSSEVVALVEGDLDGLTFVDGSFVHFWSPATGDRCQCGYVGSPHPERSDPMWCRSCAGLIVPDGSWNE